MDKINLKIRDLLDKHQVNIDLIWNFKWKMWNLICVFLEIYVRIESKYENTIDGFYR